MHKKIWMFLLLLIGLLPLVTDAKTILVNNQDELLEALKDTTADTITLGKDIETTQKINITRPVTIDGDNHTMKYVGTFGEDKSKSNTVWGGIYVLQVYKTKATIKDIKLTGGNAALLVNGSEVNLEGTIDVSGNGFGGIELGQGVNVTEDVKLNLAKDINVVNKTEKDTAPTIWVAKDSEDATITMNGVTKTLKTGEEFSIDEIEEIIGIDIEKNPNTGDNITLYVSLLMISMVGIFVSNKYLKRNNA